MPSRIEPADVVDARTEAIPFQRKRMGPPAGDFMLLDTQFVTDHLATFGAIEIPREAYHAQLAAAMRREADFYSLPEDCGGEGALQSIGHTS